MIHRNLGLRAFAVIVAVGSLCSPFVIAATSAPEIIVTFPAAAKPPRLKEQNAAWRADGLTRDALRMEAVAQEQPGFSVMLVLEMTSEDAVARWHAARRLPVDVRVRRVDMVIRSGDIGEVAADTLFEINVYRLKTSVERYRQFCAEYIAPLMEGQIAAGVMAAYTMYVERDSDGDRHAVLVKAYRDAATFNEKVADVKLAVRARLESQHPTYPKWHPIKDTFRENVSETRATIVRD